MAIFGGVSLTLKLQVTFLAITALLIWRLRRIYRSPSLTHLAVGWTLWMLRSVSAIVGAMAIAAHVEPHEVGRRLLSGLALAVGLGSVHYLRLGTLGVANIPVQPPRRWWYFGAFAALMGLLAVATTGAGAPPWWRLTLLLTSSTAIYIAAFTYLAWRLLRAPADELTTGRQLAGAMFVVFAAKQFYNVWTYLRAGAPASSPSAYSETVIYALVAMGTVALLLERERIRGIGAVREQQRLEAEMAEREHLESLGRLAGGVAHDFNNMLTAILGNAQLVRMQLEERERSADGATELQEIEATATRAASLTRQLLAFARREPVTPVHFDVVQSVRRLQPQLRRRLSQPEQLTVELPEMPLFVLGDPARIEQAVVNLVDNAREAIDPQHGRIVVRVSLDPHPHRGEGAVHVAVADNGVGMPADVAARVFEPFFTTKGREKGTGLGLSVVHGAVRQAGGDITVTSSPGAGSCFDIFLPRMGAPAAPNHVVASPSAVAARGCTVMVVDDDPLVRRVAARLLGKHGCRVLEAGDADEALRIHAEQDGDVQLLLTDIMMPGPSGRALARLLGERDPTVAVAFMSGYDPDAMKGEPLPASAVFIAKPFTEQTLLAGMHTALAARATSAV